MFKIIGLNLTIKTVPIITSPSFSSTKFKIFTGMYTYSEVNGRSPSDRQTFRLSERFNLRFATSALQLSSHFVHTNVGNNNNSTSTSIFGWLTQNNGRRQRGRVLEFRHTLSSLRLKRLQRLHYTNWIINYLLFYTGVLINR